MLNVTTEHLAAIMLQAKQETALHVRNVGIYGNSSEPDNVEGWLQVRDYYDRKTLQTWTYDQKRPSQYRNVMAAAERLVEVYCERLIAQRVLDILTEHLAKADARRTLH